MSAPAPLATSDEVAAYLRITVESLSQMRYLGTGPVFRKLGNRVRYDWADVTAWVESVAATSTGPAA